MLLVTRLLEIILVIVNGVQLPSLSAINSNVNFILFQYTAVRNLNHTACFPAPSNSSIIGSPVWFMFIANGEIDACRTQYMTTSNIFSTKDLSRCADPGVWNCGCGRKVDRVLLMELEIEGVIEMP
ncbi:hypothetical protein L195_g007970 [Trifolium pratense]|uniref:Uncharacterized protein n=1 Tax=Trifolium pratense TaxID=57577 RepID=A0A2K3P7V2_TRIPR|nr:hypothetical protein L195_g007970 [Trifolium pratense]